MKRIPSPRDFRSPSRFSTSIRVEASSMLMISSATSSRMSSMSARAMSMRCSWPPLSWWGYLPSTSPGLRLTASSDASSFACHSASLTPGEVLAAEHREDAVGLEDRVVRAERILEDALHVAVVLLQLLCRSRVEMSTPSNVIAPRVTRRRRRIIFPMVDLPLPLSPMSDTTSPGAHLEADAHGQPSSSPPPKAPTRYDLQQVSTLSIRLPPSSTRPPDRARPRRTAALRRTSRTRVGIAP